MQQFVDIRWGCVTDIHMLEDALNLRTHFDRMPEAGFEEVRTSKIADD